MPVKFLILLFICVESCAFASESDSTNSVNVSEETDLGSSEVSQAISLTDSFGSDAKQGQPWSLGASYNYQRTTTANSGQADIVDITRSAGGDFAWSGNSGWGFALSLSYSTTPAENLTSRGATLTVSHLWKQEGSDEQEFSPTFSLGLLGGKDTYAQYYSTTIAPRNKKSTARTVSGTVDLQQFLLGFDADWQPVNEWEFELTVKAYPYSHSPSEFQSYLDSARAVSTGISAFAGTVGGLPDSSFAGDIKWYFRDSWRNDFSLTTSALAVGGRLDTQIKDTVEYEFVKSWKLNAGAQYESSLSSSYWLGIIGLGVLF